MNSKQRPARRSKAPATGFAAWMALRPWQGLQRELCALFREAGEALCFMPDEFARRAAAREIPPQAIADLRFILAACPRLLEALLRAPAGQARRTALDRVVRVLMQKHCNRSLAIKYLYTLLSALGRQVPLYGTECAPYADGERLLLPPDPDCPPLSALFRDGKAPDPAAIDRLEVLAARREPSAMTTLGVLSLDGALPSHPPREGLRLLKTAAACGSTVADARLCAYYYERAQRALFPHGNYRRALEYAAGLGAAPLPPPAFGRMQALLNVGVYQRQLTVNRVLLALVFMLSFVAVYFLPLFVELPASLAPGAGWLAASCAVQALLAAGGAAFTLRRPYGANAWGTLLLLAAWAGSMLLWIF